MRKRNLKKKLPSLKLPRLKANKELIISGLIAGLYTGVTNVSNLQTIKTSKERARESENARINRITAGRGGKQYITGSHYANFK